LASLGPTDDFILTEILKAELEDIIEKSRYWVDGFNAIFHEAVSSKNANKDTLQKLLEDDITFDLKLKSEEQETEKILSELDESLTAQRISQSAELEEKSTRLEVLGDKVDRAARLNEKEKNDLQIDVIVFISTLNMYILNNNSGVSSNFQLMAIQTEIQETQSRSFERRQEREMQTSDMHRGMIEQERESHEWFKGAIQKQHSMLEKELSLEREIGSRRALHMAEKFKIEAEHLHELENIRVAGQNEIQTYKENRFKKREKDFKDHEILLSRYNAQINELDAKLALTSAVHDVELKNRNNLPLTGTEGEKKCSVM
jgi:hypothetical protein